jgi:hypothetical protein
LLALTGAVATAPDALASDRGDRGAVWDRPVAVDGHAGLDGPYGLLGISAEVTPVRFLTLAAGAGWYAAPRFAFVPRVRLPVPGTGFAIGAGAGLSYGASFASNGSCYGFLCGVDATWAATYRVFSSHLETSLEHRWRSGVELRVSAGWSHVLQATRLDCSSPFADRCPAPEQGLGADAAYADLALGYAFAF